MTGQPDDRNLRGLLHDAVDHVEPEHGPDEVRARATGRSRWAGSGAVTVVAAALATVLALTGAVWLVQRDQSGRGVAATAPGGATAVLFEPVDTLAGPRLRADREVVADGQDALDVALRGSIADGGWPAGTVVSGARTADGIVIDLAPPAGTAVSSTGPDRLDLQALVWAATTTLAEPASVVRFTLDGRRVGSLGSVDVSRPLARDRSNEVLAPVVVTSVGDGETVSSPLTVSGLAATFEATVAWRVLDGSTVVDEGSTMAEECCSPTPYSFDLALDPGTYTLEVGETTGADPGEGYTPYVERLQVTVE